MKSLIFCLAFSTFCAQSWSTPEDEFCSNVNQMHRHCLGRGHAVPVTRAGKAGPRGPKGEKGERGVVDLVEIDRQIAEKVAETAADLDAKFSQCQQSLQQAHERIDQLDEKLKPLLITDCRKVTPGDAKWTNDKGGVFDIYISGHKKEVYCDLTTDDGGWLVFQRRLNGSVDFYRGWAEYVSGFGSKRGEFWLGLDTLRQITSSADYELRVDLEDWDGNTRFARYSIFKVGDEASNYQLTVDGYSGTASDSMSRQNRRAFTTKDGDHDAYGDGNCAVTFKGAWWYENCHNSNLNGLYHKGGAHSSFADGINWETWKGHHYSMKYADMKIRLL